MHQMAPATTVQRSPRCIVIIEAGMLLTSEPTPINATIKAVIGTEAPIARAVSGITGRMAPSPIPKRSDGPKAVIAMRRSENSVWVIDGL